MLCINVFLRTKFYRIPLVDQLARLVVRLVSGLLRLA